YGDTRAVRRQLGLLQRYQDPSGKIFHEISTSGSVHDDAADATPLYVILAAHYLRASGDTGFIRESWPKISLAVEYLYSTDTDGDLLIENTNQGHGWVEGGNLYPVHTEFYLAGAWCRALLDASTIASILGRNEQAEKYGRDGGKVKEILNRDFWNDETRFFNFGKLAAGGFNPEPTVLPATVMYYGLLDDAKVRPVLEQYAGAGFSSDWGVRIVSSSSKLFNPQGYHYGSVWPLFTGWTALAEYEYGNSTQGFTHILNNMYIKNHWALGFVEEVMNGSVYRPSGVCPHQCWSETNILHPAITGMVGWKPDAVDHSAGLSPRFPAHWDSVKVNRLRVGDRLIDFSMIRNERKTVWTFATAGGSPVTVHFAPELPEGMTITRVTLDGRDLPPPAGRRRALIDPPIDITPGRSGAKLVFEHTGGIGVVPPGPRPEPGDSSTGHRIVSASLEGDVYSIVLDGKPGTTAAVELRTFGVSVGGADNATVRRGSVANSSLVEVKFPGSALPYVRTIVKVHTVKN
ncbi:MAG TPA: GH116 family glycosyl hydrolase, partial [Bacteroidota bacterium]|nr:GH116 family glycosyl hydrolase [Bacteroidota bacterium]